MKKPRSTDFCADRIDVITNVAVMTNAVIKRVHCNFSLSLEKLSSVQFKTYDTSFHINICFSQIISLFINFVKPVCYSWHHCSEISFVVYLYY